MVAEEVSCYIVKTWTGVGILNKYINTISQHFKIVFHVLEIITFLLTCPSFLRHVLM